MSNIKKLINVILEFFKMIYKAIIDNIPGGKTTFIILIIILIIILAIRIYSTKTEYKRK